MFFRWPIEIDGLPIKHIQKWWFSIAMLVITCHNQMVTGSRNRGEKISFRTTQWYSLSGMILPVIWVVADQLALRYCWLWHMRYCWLWHIDKRGGKHGFFQNGTCHNDVIMWYKTREQQIIITGRKIIWTIWWKMMENYGKVWPIENILRFVPMPHGTCPGIPGKNDRPGHAVSFWFRCDESLL